VDLYKKRKKAPDIGDAINLLTEKQRKLSKAGSECVRGVVRGVLPSRTKRGREEKLRTERAKRDKKKGIHGMRDPCLSRSLAGGSGSDKMVWEERPKDQRTLWVQVSRIENTRLPARSKSAKTLSFDLGEGHGGTETRDKRKLWRGKGPISLTKKAYPFAKTSSGLNAHITKMREVGGRVYPRSRRGRRKRDALKNSSGAD